MPELAYRGLIRPAARVHADQATGRLHVNKKRLCGGIAPPRTPAAGSKSAAGPAGEGAGVHGPAWDRGVQGEPESRPKAPGLPLFEQSRLAGFLFSVFVFEVCEPKLHDG